MQDEEIEHIHIIELQDSLLVILKDSLMALMVRLRIDASKKNPQELLDKQLAKYGLLFDHIRPDGNLVYKLDKTNFEKRLDKFEWPERLQIIGNYLEQNSFYCWSNYYKTQWEEFEFLIHESIQGNEHVSKKEHWIIEKGKRELSETEIERTVLPSAVPDPLVVDLAHWRLEDKAFQEERKTNWPMIEDILTNCWFKKKKFINVIKKFYLKGELPDWAELNNVDHSSDLHEGHLDITSFLWLHPSDDPNVLAPLAKAYYAGYGRRANDVQVGMRYLFQWGIFPKDMWRGDWVAKCPCFQGKARLLFNVIYADLEGNTFNMEVKGPYRIDTTHEVTCPGWGDLEASTRWLCFKKIHPYDIDMILQHEEVLHFTFKMINLDPKNVLYNIKNFPENVILALYRIANFDIEKEGESPRILYVNNVRKILNDRNNLPELQNLWGKIKNNEIPVKNPWRL